MIERIREEWDGIYDQPDMQDAARKLRIVPEQASASAAASQRMLRVKRRILVDPVNPDVTIGHLCSVFSESGEFFERGTPVRVVYDHVQGGAVAIKMDPDGIVLAAHRLARPFMVKESAQVDARLPKSIAAMYLSDKGGWNLPVLNGIASAPLLSEDGSIRSAKGYDPECGFWLENVPDLQAMIPAQPALDDAVAALRLIRENFKTFCFADAEIVHLEETGVAVLDLDQAPGMDESAFLTMLLTAVCRPSLQLAPGALFTAAETSGAGTGKGKLARCISAIAYGRQPSAITAGSGVEELEKRIAAKLVESAPAILIDNVNGAALKSNLLACALTERPAEIRILGRTETAKLNASAFIAITGNGLRFSEDLARRFIEVRFDAKTEDPEARPFRGDIVADIAERRNALLAACLMIWRWGRHNDIKPGKPLGGFEQWTRWVRDPLVALGCIDPVERIAEAKRNDPRRQRTAEVLNAWWKAHGNTPVTAKDLDLSVQCLIDPQNRGRQYVAAYVASLAGTRLAGFVMTKQAPAGKWNAMTYTLEIATPEPHRTHRTHRQEPGPMGPMSPMPSAVLGNFANGEGFTEEDL